MVFTSACGFENLVEVKTAAGCSPKKLVITLGGITSVFMFIRPFCEITSI